MGSIKSDIWCHNDATHTFRCNQALTGNPQPVKRLVSHIVLLEVTFAKHAEGVRQACPNSGPRAKSGPQSNFVRPVAWFKIIKWIRPAAGSCDHRHCINIYVCMMSLVATNSRKKKKKGLHCDSVQRGGEILRANPVRRSFNCLLFSSLFYETNFTLKYIFNKN